MAYKYIIKRWKSLPQDVGKIEHNWGEKGGLDVDMESKLQ